MPGTVAVIVPAAVPAFESVSVAVIVAVEPYGPLAGEIVAVSVPVAADMVTPL